MDDRGRELCETCEAPGASPNTLLCDGCWDALGDPGWDGPVELDAELWGWGPV